jgi:hypothetical protein
MPEEICLPSVQDSRIVINIGPMFFSTDTIGTCERARARASEERGREREGGGGKREGGKEGGREGGREGGKDGVCVYIQIYEQLGDLRPEGVCLRQCVV